MALSNSCPECGSRDLNDSLLQDRGEVTCRDCGVEQKDYTNLDSSSPPRREGDDNRAKGPTTRQRPKLEIDDNVRYGDRVWNLPPLSAERKRGESKRKKEAREEIEGLSEDLKEIKNEISQIESKIDAKKIEYLENWLEELNALVDEEGLIEAHTMLIETLRNGLESDLDPSLIENMTRLSEKLSREEEVVELSSRIHNPDDGLERKKEWKERDLARLFAKIHRTGPPGKNEDWMFKHQARDFLQLGPAQGDEQLDWLVKELCPGINWVELVTEVISNPTLPDRAPEGDD